MHATETVGRHPTEGVGGHRMCEEVEVEAEEVVPMVTLGEVEVMRGPGVVGVEIVVRSENKEDQNPQGGGMVNVIAVVKWVIYHGIVLSRGQIRCALIAGEWDMRRVSVGLCLKQGNGL